MAEDQRKGQRVQCTVDGPRESFFVSHQTEPFCLQEFNNKLYLKVLHAADDKVVFELKGCDVSFANAIRRILISEVPTAAIETVQIWQNTGVIQDEVLAHRLGLIPFRVDPYKLKYRDPSQDLNEENSLKFKLHVKCTPADIKPHQNSMPVYARDLTWIPLSERQRQKFAAEPPAPVHPDILITKLRPGQEIELFAFLEKGLGKTHAKWSPVATAVYRLEPEFVFTKPIKGEEAKELKELCPMNVFDIEDASGVAYAKYPRNCTTCRACVERFEGRLQLNKIANEFIFSIESTCAIPAPKLFTMAVEVLREKAITFREIIRTKQLE